MGMGLIIQDLIRIYRLQHQENMPNFDKYTIMAGALENWIQVQDAKAKVVLQQTKRALERRYLMDEDDATPKKKSAPPSLTQIPHSMTRSMTKRATQDSETGMQTRRKRRLYADDELPTVPEVVAKKAKKQR